MVGVHHDNNNDLIIYDHSPISHTASGRPRTTGRMMRGRCGSPKIGTDFIDILHHKWRYKRP